MLLTSEPPFSQESVKGWGVPFSENLATFLDLKTLKGARLKDRSYNNFTFKFCVVTLKKFVISIGTKSPSDILDTGES